MDFKVKDGEQVRTIIAEKASATVIEAGDLVAISSGLIIKATAASTAIAYCPKGAAAGVTKVEISKGNDFTLKATADAVFAKTHRGVNVDVVVTSNVQYIDIGTTSTEVLTVGVGQDSGVVGSASNVEVKINKPIF